MLVNCLQYKIVNSSKYLIILLSEAISGRWTKYGKYSFKSYWRRWHRIWNYLDKNWKFQAVLSQQLS